MLFGDSSYYPDGILDLDGTIRAFCPAHIFSAHFAVLLTRVNFRVAFRGNACGIGTSKKFLTYMHASLQINICLKIIHHYSNVKQGDGAVKSGMEWISICRIMFGSNVMLRSSNSLWRTEFHIWVVLDASRGSWQSWEIADNLPPRVIGQSTH